ncbi:CDGSH iron-sulfur domain-containing protein [Arthrobacter sp. Sa2BUA2]|uniref:CDGSH iron-sulfur domain-containing protein n=2 Tax=Arthrobacter pullicola TaxID=2762224 RepID=A0ABR8YDJ5_9MICC|nr:CDGSH iron-sulfur domain-containing protein [Arthrobacter pullicola]
MACPGGPLLVRGDFEVVDADGTPVPKNRETVALCRCGGSKIKPWCDGTHKLLKHGSAKD